MLNVVRYGCNPVALFDAQVQKHCPEDFMNIKVIHLEQADVLFIWALPCMLHLFVCWVLTLLSNILGHIPTVPP